MYSHTMAQHIWSTTDPDRKNSVLNPRSRLYLIDENKLEPKSEHSRYHDLIERINNLDIEPKSDKERQVRQEIRKRVLNSTMDLNLVVNELEQRDKRKILNDGWDSKRADELREEPPMFVFRDELDIFIQFIYDLYQADTDTGPMEAVDMLEEDIYEAIERTHIQKNENPEISVDIDLSFPSDFEELYERYENAPETLEKREVMRLNTNDYISNDELIEWIQNAD